MKLPEKVADFLKKFGTNSLKKLFNLTKSSQMIHAVSRMSIRNRLIFFFLALSIIPLILMGVISYMNSKAAITAKITTYSTDGLNQAVANLDLSLEKYSDIALQFLSDNTRAQLLLRYGGTKDTVELFNISRSFTDIINGYSIQDMSLSGAYFVSLQRPDKPLIYGGNTFSVSLDKLPFLKNDKPVWVYFEKKLIYVLPFQDVSMAERIGTLLIVIDPAILNSRLNPDLENEDQSRPYSLIINEKMQVIVTPVVEDLGADFAKLLKRDPKDLGKVLAKDKQGQFTGNIAGNNVLIHYTYVEDQEWYLLSIAPLSFLYAESGRVGLWVVVLVLLISVAAVFISVAVAEGISQPLDQVVGAMSQAREGDLTVKAGVNTRDELGRLSGSFNEMIAQIHRLIEDTREAIAAVTSGSKELEESSRQSAQTAESVASAMGEITRGTMEQTAESERTARQMSDLAGRIEEAAQQSAAVERITGATRDLSAKSKNVIDHLLRKANDTGQITKTITADIVELNSSAAEILRITEIIANIAEQTNLLALNAAIEAARAGEAGRGFAVVANEVNKLAAQTQEAAKTIAVNLQAIRTKAQNSEKTALQAHQIVAEQLVSVQSVQQTFDEITNAMENAVSEIDGVNQKIRQINAVKEETVKSIMSITAITEEAAAAAEEVSASSQEQTSIAEQVSSLADHLLAMSQKLTEVVARFKVG